LIPSHGTAHGDTIGRCCRSTREKAPLTPPILFLVRPPRSDSSALSFSLQKRTSAPSVLPNSPRSHDFCFWNEMTDRCPPVAANLRCRFRFAMLQNTHYQSVRLVVIWNGFTGTLWSHIPAGTDLEKRVPRDSAVDCRFPSLSVLRHGPIRRLLRCQSKRSPHAWRRWIRWLNVSCLSSLQFARAQDWWWCFLGSQFVYRLRCPSANIHNWC
jgi:hypothetical protein